MCSSALRCTFLAIALTICIKWGHTKAIAITKGWYSNLCCHMDDSYLCSSPAEVSSPFTVYLLGDHWAHNRSWDSNIRTPGQNEGIVLWFGWVHIEHMVFWRIHRMNWELRTVCFLLVELWMSSGQQWFLILWRNQSTFCDSIMEMAHLQHYFYSPNDQITIRRPCQNRRDTYWETLLWTELAPKCWLKQSYPVFRRRCQAVICESRVSFQFFHFLILRELIIRCGWRSKIANDSGSVAHCR